MKSKIAILFIWVFSFTGFFSQGKKTDSLFRVFKNTGLRDTIRLNALNDAGIAVAGSDPDSAITIARAYYVYAKSKNLVKHMTKALMLEGMANIYLGESKTARSKYEQALVLAKEMNDQKLAASALSNIGVSHYSVADYDSAVIYANKALDIRIKIKDFSGMAASYNNIANAYLNLSNYNQALIYYLMSLKLYESNKNETEIAKAYNNIGNLYNMQKRYATAEEYYLKAIVIRKKINDLTGLSSCYSNLGIIESSLKNMPKAIDYFKQSLEISEKINDYNGMVIAYGSLGDVYKDLGQYALAREYIERSMALSVRTNDNYAIAANYNSLADVAVLEGKYALAIDLAKKALKINTEENIVDGIRLNYQSIANASSALHDYKNAFEYYVKYKELTDSIFNLDNSKMLSEAKTQYEVDKKAAELKIKAEAEKDKLNVIAKEEKRRNVLIIFSVTGILLVVLLFSVFLFKRFKVTQKQKVIIESQKLIVEEKNKEITDSIAYAKRLQQAILPPKEFVNEFLPQNFIIYKPKDIVAGDFYWMEVVDEKIFIAVADSTGHGVPGALVSVVCSNALNRSVKEFKLYDTGKILDKTRDLVLETFAKSTEQVKDGMDISLLCINKKENTIQWSGANNPLWYIKDAAADVSEIKPDKQPVGQTDNPKPFTLHNIELNKGDMFYLFTDGFADQFGGPAGKKFKYKQFKDVLLLGSTRPMKEQAKALSNEFNAWKGELEQVDDVCIIGIKI